MDALTDPMIASQFGRLERRIAELEAEVERLRGLVREAGEAFEAASEGGGVNFHAYALDMKAALQENA